MHSTIEGKRLLAALGISPVYVVNATDPPALTSEAELRFIESKGEADCIYAFTSPVCDLLLQNALAYEWQGRGFCMVFRQSPLVFSEAEVLGIMLHEAGHYVAYCDRPERDEPDRVRAIEASWKSMQHESESHNSRWLRATVHLWHRATAGLGYEIPFSATVNLEQYGFSRADFAPLLNEASRREGEPIESILAEHQPSPRVATQPRSRQRSTYPRAQFLAGQAVLVHRDGAIETTPDVYGRGGGMRYQSVGDFLNAREFARAS